MSELMLDVGTANELKMAFRRAGYEASEVKSLSEGDILARVREVLLGRAEIVPIEMVMKPVSQLVHNTFTVPLYLTLAERITAGKYDWTNPDIISERFPHNPTTVGDWEFDLISPNNSISSEKAKKEVEVDGWAAAEWEHVLTYGAAFPDEQKKFPIIALGSVCEVGGRRYVLGLWYDGNGKRGVRFCSVVEGFDPFYRFLRVRKVNTSVT